MRAVSFQSSCHGSGAVAGCWGVLAAFRSSGLAVIVLQPGTWGTVAAWLGEGSFGDALGQHAA